MKLTSVIKQKKEIAAVVLSLLLLSACSDSDSNRKQQSFQQPFKSMLVYPKKNKIIDFELSRHDKTKFDQTSFSGRWNLIFMGYTNCPDVCPTTLLDISNIYKKINPELQKKFQILFLSVDPTRDNPEHIGQYIDYFHDDLVGVTGNKPEIDKLVAALGGIYSLNTEEGEFYTVDHSARIFIVSPKGERYGIISSEAMHNKDKTELVSELEKMASTQDS